MAKQYVRLADVRPPSAQDDAQTTAQLTANSYSAESAEAFLSTVLSQIRILTGQPRWQDAPHANITSIATTQAATAEAIAAIQPVVETTHATTVDQSDAIAALEQAVNTGQTQLDALQHKVDSLKQADAGDYTLAQAQQEIVTLRDSLNAQQANVNQAMASLQTLADRQAEAEDALQSNFALLNAAVQAIQNAVYDQPLLGVKNGVNLSFSTLQPFVPETLRLYYNGVRQCAGPANDFTVSPDETTLGYTKVTLLARQVAPRAVDTLTVDYIPAT